MMKLPLTTGVVAVFVTDHIGHAYQQADIVTAFNIFRGKLDDPLNCFFQAPTRPQLRVDPANVNLPSFRHQRRQQTFSFRVGTSYLLSLSLLLLCHRLV